MGYEIFLFFDNDVWCYFWDGVVLIGGESFYVVFLFVFESEYFEFDEFSNVC